MTLSIQFIDGEHCSVFTCDKCGQPITDADGIVDFTVDGKNIWHYHQKPECNPGVLLKPGLRWMTLN